MVSIVQGRATGGSSQPGRSKSGATNPTGGATTTTSGTGEASPTDRLPRLVQAQLRVAYSKPTGG
jgi:hypothetical protein